MPRQIAPEHLVGLLAIGGADQPQFAGQAVLERSPESLDPAFGLGRQRQDQLDAELLEQSSKLGRLSVPGQLLFEAQLAGFGFDEDPMAIGIQRHRDAVSLYHLPEQLEVPFGILCLAEARPGHPASRIIDAAHQAEPGTTPLQPVVPAGVDLQQHALAGIAIAATPVPWRATSARRRNARRLQDSMDRRTGQPHAVLFGQHLREVVLVEPGVLGLGQPHHALREHGIQRMPRRSAAIAMDQGGRPLLLIGAPQSLDLPNGQAQQRGGLSVHHRPCLQLVEDQKTLLVRSAQVDAVSLLHWVTESQNR